MCLEEDTRREVQRRIDDLSDEFGGIDVDDEEIVEARWFESSPDDVVDFLQDKVGEWETGRH